MKKRLVVGLYMLSLVTFAISCKEHKEEEKHDKHADIEKHEHTTDTVSTSSEIAAIEFQCPMNCEDEKTYTKPGSCPVCKMDLKEVKKESKKEESENADHQDHKDHDHE